MHGSILSKFVAFSSGLALVLPTTSKSQDLSPLNSYSVITRGDFFTTSDVEGRTIVGGNFTSSTSSTFGSEFQGKVPASDKTLRIAGNISNGNPISLNAGSLELGGSDNGRIIDYNGGGSLISNPGVNYSAILDQLSLASQALAAKSANIFSSAPSGQPGPFNIIATPDTNGVAVLLVNGSSLFNNEMVQQINLSFDGASEILINVSGNSIDWLHGNLTGSFTDRNFRDNIVWNFYEATSIDFGSKNMMGQVLAPLASITAHGNIDGSIFANSFTTTAEVHLPGYEGLYGIPEPTSLFLVSFLGTSLLLRRRRKRL